MKTGRAILIILIVLGTMLAFAIQTAALYIGAAVMLMAAIAVILYVAERKKIAHDPSARPQHTWTIWRRPEPRP
jgi:hypothetical protein